jgi:DNA-binding helix-hairpin-helix protein with protein kinase domain
MTAKQNKKSTKSKRVTDEFGQTYILKEQAGQGGQGVVYYTDHRQLLVKLSRQKNRTKRLQWLEQVRWLTRQPLEALHIAPPIARIETEKYAGFVMELMDGLIPLQQLMDDAEQMMDKEGSPVHYLQSGGIKRRMLLLAKLARTLADLHGRGMAYGDLSPANIFVSGETQHSQLWLIDCDNICINQRDSFDTQPQPGHAKGIYTPSYGAPEVVSGDSLVSSLTDAWSFAVIAFKLLTTNHPFKGDKVNEGTSELETDAYNGQLPWVYHPQDSSNQVSSGIPLLLIALKPLSALFERCFNSGKENPFERPLMSEWVEVFERMSQLLVHCQNSECTATFVFSLHESSLQCPFCNEPAQQENLVYLRHLLRDDSIANIPDTKPSDCYVDSGDRQVLNINASATVKTVPPGSQLWPDAKGLFELTLDENGLVITPCKGIKLRIAADNGRPSVVSGSVVLKRIKNRKNKMRHIITDSGDEGICNVCSFRW